MQVVEVEFAKAIATWAHANGKYFIVNCPAASMAVQHLADLVTCDSNGVKDHWSMGSRLVSLAYGKRHLLLPNLGPPATSELWLQHGLRSLFYAEVPCLWQPGAPGEDSLTMEAMAEATYPLAIMLADSTPLGGDDVVPIGRKWQRIHRRQQRGRRGGADAGFTGAHAPATGQSGVRGGAVGRADSLFENSQREW